MADTITPHLPGWWSLALAAVQPPTDALPFDALCDTMTVPGDQVGQRLPWAWRSHPAQRRIIEVISSRQWTRHIIISPTQRGKTLTGVEAPIIWTATQLRRPIGYAAPTRELIRRFWLSKFRDDCRSCGYEWILPPDGVGSGTGVPDVAMLAGMVPMTLMTGGGRSEAPQAMSTIWAMIVEEFDAISAHNLGLLIQRTSKHHHPLIVLSSTIKHDHSSLAVAEMSLSTQETPHLRCPACGQFFVPAWEHIRYDASSIIAARESVRLQCPHEQCAAMLDESQRHQAITGAVCAPRGCTVAPDGTIDGSPPDASSWGIIWGDLADPLSSMPQLAEEHVVAQRKIDADNDHEAMRTFYRDRLARQYHAATEDVPRVIETVVAQRSALGDYLRGEVPNGAGRITLAVDVQKRWLYYMVCAHMEDDSRMALVDWDRLRVCGDDAEPTERDLVRALDQIDTLSRDGWPMGDEVLLPEICGVDVGYQTDILVRWLKHRKPRWVALVGAGREKVSRMAISPGALRRRLPGWYEIREQPGGWSLHFVDADAVRGRVHDGLVMPWNAPGAVLLPRGIAADDHIARHLTAEVREASGPGGGVMWIKRHQRNDWQDTASYNRMLGRLLAHRAGEDRIEDAPAPAQAEAYADAMAQARAMGAQRQRGAGGWW